MSRPSAANVREKTHQEKSMATLDLLQSKIDLLAEIAKTDTSETVQNAYKSAAADFEKYKQQAAAGNNAEADKLAQNIIQLADSVYQVAQQRAQSKLGKAWPIFGMVVLAIAFLALIGFLFFYIRDVGLNRLATIEGTRPLLVISAIVSTILFGGALLLGSLFSSEGTYEDRFRHAREIFLVFSGIFGTVIGFYFGASDSKGPQLNVSATLEDTTLVANVVGGTPPYKVTVAYGKGCSKTEESKQGWARFVFDKTLNNLAGAKISAIDSKALQGEFSLSEIKDQLDKDKIEWAKENTPCDGKKPPTPPQLAVKIELVDTGVSAKVTGGTPPYTATITYGPKRCKLVKKDIAKDAADSVIFALGKSTNNLFETEVSVVDSNKQEVNAPLAKTKEDLVKLGWTVADDVKCP
jgi:hypothetical protein